jgi:hypothetical protein
MALAATTADKREEWVDFNQNQMMMKALKNQAAKRMKIHNKRKTKKRVDLTTTFEKNALKNLIF